MDIVNSLTSGVTALLKPLSDKLCQAANNSNEIVVYLKNGTSHLFKKAKREPSEIASVHEEGLTMQILDETTETTTTFVILEICGWTAK